jgi:uncharacterized protein
MQLVIQPTRFCNIDCSYCYLDKRTDRSVIESSTLRLIGQHILWPSRTRGRPLEVLWHGCEPLSLKPLFYDDAFSVLAEYYPPGLHHVFQTNATLINEQWTRFFERHDIRVGVSIDGPIEIHDRQRRYRSGKGSFNRVMDGIKFLRNNMIKFDCICVLTEDSIRHPTLLFDFFSQIGAERLSLSPEDISGAHKLSTIGNNLDTLRQFWKTYLALAQTQHHGPIIQEFAQPLLKAQTEPEGISGVACEGVYIMVDVEGSISTFSPEFMTWPTGDRRRYQVGHVSDPKCLEFDRSKDFLKLREEIRRGIAKCRESCTYFAYCGGGVPASKVQENGTCDSTETLACKARIKLVVDAICDTIGFQA